MAKNKIILILLFWFIPNFYYSSNTIHDCVIETSESFIGIDEKGGNNGGFTNTEFQKMMYINGWRKGSSWCAFFVKSILNKCGIPNSITGWSPTSYNKKDVIYTNGKWEKTYSDEDVIVMSMSYSKFKNNKARYKGIGHTGIFVKKDGLNSILTIEGNTNDAGTRDSRVGDGVYKKKRKLSKNIHLTRWYKK